MVMNLPMHRGVIGSNLNDGKEWLTSKDSDNTLYADGIHDLKASQIANSIQPLYTFTTHTFTTASNDISRDGPTLNEAKSAYCAVTWAQSSSFLNVVNGGTQLWVVPETSQYNIAVSYTHLRAHET